MVDRIVTLLQEGGRNITRGNSCIWHWPEGADPRIADVLRGGEIRLYAVEHPESTPHWYLIGFRHAEPSFDPGEDHVPRSLREPSYRAMLRAVTGIIRSADTSRSYFGFEDLLARGRYAYDDTDADWQEFKSALRTVPHGGNQQPAHVAAVAAAQQLPSATLDQRLRRSAATFAALVPIVGEQILAHVREIDQRYAGPNFYAMGQLLIHPVSVLLAEQGVSHVAVVRSA